MAVPALTAHFDHAQPRFSRDRIGIALTGKALGNRDYLNGCIFEPVTNSLILKPKCYEDTWDTSNSGAYAKLALSDFGSPTGFKEADRSGTGVKKYITHGDINKDLITSGTYAKNTGFVVSFLNYSNGSTGGILLECGWSTVADVSDDVAFRLYANGIGEIWKGGVKVADGRVAASGGSKQNETLTLVLMPCRKKELLVWAVDGSTTLERSRFSSHGMRAVFDDIDDDDADPEITPASNFWVRQPNVSMCIMVAPLKFATSGTAASELFTLAEAPDLADVYETFDNASWAGGAAQDYRIYGDQSYRTGNTDAASASLVESDGSTAFTPDGTMREVRIKTSLSGDGNSSPTIYGAELGFANLGADTDDSEVFDATDYLVEWNLEVPDGKNGATVTAHFVRDDVLYAGVAGIEVQSNRPLRFDMGTTVIMDGRTGPPSFSRLLDEQAQDIKFQVYDQIQALKRYKIRDLKPFDGMTVSHASNDCVIRFLLNLIKFPSARINLETASVSVGEKAPSFCEQWAEFADVGATALEVLDRFMEDYLGGWFYAFVPTAAGIDFVTKSPATLAAQSPVFKLYWSTADAVADGVASGDAWKHVMWTHDRSIIEAEGNEVIVSGIDNRTDTAISARKRDASAQDPTLAPSARPNNWAGEPVRIGMISGGINTLAVASSGASLLFDRGSAQRVLDEVSCEMMIRDSDGLPVWRGDKITLDGFGDVIVQSFSASSTKEPNGADEWQRRPASYVSSNIMGSTGGVSKKAITGVHIRWASSAFMIRRNSGDAAKARRSSFVEVP